MTSLDWIMTTIFAGAGLCVLAALREHVVLRATNRRCRSITALNAACRRVGAWEFPPCQRVTEAWAGYGRRLFDLRKWTYRQFFPEPVMDPGIAALHGIDWEEP